MMGGATPTAWRGTRYPIEVGIISTCDAFDAMCHTRHYRRGMGQEGALAVLSEHAGSQWNAEAVALVVATIQSGTLTGSALDDVGRAVAAEELACGCADALPDEVRELALAGRGPS